MKHVYLYSLANPTASSGECARCSIQVDIFQFAIISMRKFQDYLFAGGVNNRHS